jgi:predicted metal-dependent phosphoesterase TrpH
MGGAHAPGGPRLPDPSPHPARLLALVALLTVLALLATQSASAAPPAPLVQLRGAPADVLRQSLAEGIEVRHYAVDGHAHPLARPGGLENVRAMMETALERDVDALVLTDHNSVRAGKHLRRIGPGPAPGGRPLLILGEEAGTRGGHVGLWSVSGRTRRDTRRQDGMAPVLALLDAAAKRQPRALTVLNHPAWKLGARWLRARHFDPRQPGPKFDAFEIWNGRSMLRLSTRRVIGEWEGLLAEGARPSIVGSSDAHEAAHIGRPATVVLATDLHPTALVAAVQAGRTYVTDDARVAFSVDGRLPGQILRQRGPTSVRIEIRGWSRRGGLLRLLDGRTAIVERRVSPGPFQLILRRRRLEADSDGYLRVEITRREMSGGKMGEVVGLVTAPVYVDVAPQDDFWAPPPAEWRRMQDRLELFPRVAQWSP